MQIYYTIQQVWHAHAFRMHMSHIVWYIGDIISNWLRWHQQNLNLSVETWGWCVKIIIFSSVMDSICHISNIIMHVLLWWNVYMFTQVLLCCLFPCLLHNSGKKHQKQPSSECMNSLPLELFCIIIPPETKFRGGILDSPCSSVRLSVRASVRPSVRLWVGVRMITLILFSGFNFFFTYITWVKILHGIEYQRPTSLNMRILADHVTYSFLAFPKSIF